MTLADHIILVLRAGPISTPELIRRTAGEMSHARSRVWVTLSKLYANGHVQKAYGRTRRNKHRVALWRLAE